LAEALNHVQTCAACQAAMADFDRISEALALGSSRESISEPVPRDGWGAFETGLISRTGWVRPWRRPAISSIAASLLVGALLVFLAARNHRQTIAVATGSSATQPSINFTANEVSQRASAFDEISTVFDRRASWVVVSDAVSDVGLSPKTLPDANLLLMRLAVTRNKQLVSSADLAIVPGQSANLTLPASVGPSLYYRISTTAGDTPRLSLDIHLAAPGEQDRPIAALATTLDVQPGREISAGKLVTDSGDYEVEIAFARAAAPKAGNETSRSAL
jgi:hypothetical protein